MSSRNRNVLVALGIATIIGAIIGIATWPTVPNLQRYSYPNPNAEQYQPGGSECQPTSLAAIGDRVGRLRAADACAEKAQQYRHDSSDLIQQMRAANGAEAQAKIASQGLWTAWFQTLGGFITLVAAVFAAIYARGAATEGKRAADAAHNANRPWIKVGVSPEYGFSLAPDGLAYGVDVHMKNIGNSPALDVSYVSTFLFFDPTIEQLHEYAPKWFDGDGREWRDKIIFQDDTWDRRSVAVHTGEPPGRTKVNLIVAVRYRTPFDQMWRYTVRVYSLHRVDSDGPNSLDLSDLARASRFGTASFDEHRRIAGIAT